jgi:uncharacterized protein YdhG (YjbR/CyaY superfamily)
MGQENKTIEKYISEQDETIRPRLELIHKTICAAIPDAEERISWGMPTFWKGRNIIHFAPARKHIGLYPGPEAIEAFADRLIDYKTSKGAIQLPNDRDLPLDLIADIARWSYEKTGSKLRREPGRYKTSRDLHKADENVIDNVFYLEEY